MTLSFIKISFIILGITCSIAYPLLAQQEAQYSQYMMNYYTINPGVAGTGESIEIKADVRSQWSGFEGSPKTSYLSAQGALNRVNPKDITKHKNSKYVKHFNPHGYHSLGGYIFHDATGPISRSAIYGTYAYNIGLTSTIRTSFGASIGIKQFKVDGSKLELFDAGDPMQAGQSEIVPDATVGIWIYSTRFFLGGSIHQVMGNQLDKITNTQGGGELNRHYFITGGLNININEYITWVPSILFRIVEPAPVSFDINNKVKFKDIVWGGVSYRKGDAVVLLAGFTVNKKIDFSYSYDITYSDIRYYSHGSHELVIGLRLNYKPKLHNPSDFW